MNNLLQEALNYCRMGWYIVPDHGIIDGKCTCEDTACKVQGKHPRFERESKLAYLRGEGSKNPKQVEDWWTKWPDSNVAIVCGKPSGLVAIDIDPRNNGFDSLAQLEQEYGSLPRTVTSKSGGAGLHILFAHPGGGEIRNRIGLYPGIDVKADKGRIVAPPSRHISGGIYQWDPERHPKNTALARLPRWLFEIIQTQKGTGSWQAMRKAKMAQGM